MNRWSRFFYGFFNLAMFAAAIIGLVGTYRFIVSLKPTEETKFEESIGYAGDPIQFDEDTVYIELYTDPGDVDVMNQFVSSEGTIVWENSEKWTSTGYYPQKGDLVRVKVMRQWRGDELLHGYSVTEFVSHPKPFGLIGKEIEATPDFYSETKLDKDAISPIVVIDANKDVVRVKFANDKIDTYGWGWFLVSEEDLPVSRHWEIGNQFKVGDVVCLNREGGTDLPVTTTITDVSDGDAVKVDGYTSEIGGWIDFANYELCSR